jgi:hypothetical protein
LSTAGGQVAASSVSVGLSQHMQSDKLSSEEVRSSSCASMASIGNPSPMTRRWRPGGLTSPSDGTAFRTIWLRLRVAELRQAALRPYRGRTGSPLFPLPRSNIHAATESPRPRQPATLQLKTNRHARRDETGSCCLIKKGLALVLHQRRAAPQDQSGIC